MIQVEFDEKFVTFFQSVVHMLNQHQQKIQQYSVSFSSAIELKEGKRYSKIVVNGAAFCFIDKTTGDVLKAASWSAPAKHARGNIFDEHNGLKYLTPYGPAYLR